MILKKDSLSRAAALGNVLEMQIQGPHPRPTEEEAQRVRPNYMCFFFLHF